ncbi:hypothetical protein FNF29_06743 [Cafeteria roenbergensis]|uniref:Uncharacterized protein n=1 Tax=Cafeteria roenbergensis TaxID=33653 RepID=A0A5A8D7S4_CAFRO|nr:hypothetical protein FNF29_06743 [Cafeteria roenbergensis]KAA0161503.1 hypothetical protein FNF31_03786 [Cafeteria roenbergensis]KAA0163241.1 hypothetical protein FNF28_04391 [Cafeteria roenbergensis]|eukprot:KAA0148356.1 hypothetical protein FNF29_06743 [Cafeteria roenbergensis]
MRAASQGDAGPRGQCTVPRLDLASAGLGARPRVPERSVAAEADILARIWGLAQTGGITAATGLGMHGALRRVGSFGSSMAALSADARSVGSWVTQTTLAPGDHVSVSGGYEDAQLDTPRSVARSLRLSGGLPAPARSVGGSSGPGGRADGIGRHRDTGSVKAPRTGSVKGSVASATDGGGSDWPRTPGSALGGSPPEFAATGGPGTSPAPRRNLAAQHGEWPRSAPLMGSATQRSFFESEARFHEGGEEDEGEEAARQRAAELAAAEALLQAEEEPPEGPPPHVRLRLPPTSALRPLADPHEAEEALDGALAPASGTGAVDSSGPPSVWDDALLLAHVVGAPYRLEHLAGFSGGFVPTEDSTSVLRVGTRPHDGAYVLQADVLLDDGRRGGRRPAHRRNDRFHGSLAATALKARSRKHTGRLTELSGSLLLPSTRAQSRHVQHVARLAHGAGLSVRSSLSTSALDKELSRASSAFGHGTTPAARPGDPVEAGPAPIDAIRVVQGNIRCKNGVVVHIIDRILFAGDDPSAR